MDVQESDSIGTPLQHPPGSGSVKGGSTEGAKSRRKSKSYKDQTPGGPKKAQQIHAGIKLSKEITEDIIWESKAFLKSNARINPAIFF